MLVLRNVDRVDQADDPVITESSQLIDEIERQCRLTETNHEKLQWSVDHIGRHLGHL